MTKEQMQIAIAEDQGWRMHKSVDGLCSHWTSPNHGNLRFDFVPSYPEDLNAMHEVEKHLGNGQHEIFRRYLQEAVNRDELAWISGIKDKFYTVERCVWHASAAHRAEAYLRTKGLWKD